MAKKRPPTPAKKPPAWGPHVWGAAVVVLILGLCLAFMQVRLSEVGRSPDPAKLVSLEQAARETIMRDSSPRWEAAEAAFRRVVAEGERQAAASSPAVGSARAHLGLVAHTRKDWGDCVRHYNLAMGTADAIAGILQYMRENPHPLPASETEPTTRRLIDRFAQCLIFSEPALASSSLESSPSPPHRQLYQRAVAAGAFRHEWQGAIALSPVEWRLRTQPWWSVDEAGGGELVAALKAQDLTVLQAQADAVFVRRVTPPGVNVRLNQEVSLVGNGQWLEMMLWSNGRREESCGAVPTLCAALAPHAALFHPGGHVKLSHFVGGTSALPHSGPMDAKLRMHWVLSLPPHRAAQITVGGEVRAWRQGEALVFDDSFEHHVLFDAPESAHRLVLIVDLLQPDARPHMTAAKR